MIWGVMPNLLAIIYKILINLYYKLKKIMLEFQALVMSPIGQT